MNSALKELIKNANKNHVLRKLRKITFYEKIKRRKLKISYKILKFFLFLA